MSEIIISNHNGEPVANSLEVAKNFDKNHKDVLKAIKNIRAQICALTPEPLFFEATYQTGTGKHYKCYEMTRDGFMLLAMGFSGQKAPNLVGAFFIFILRFFLFYIVFQDSFNHITKASVLFFCLLFKFNFQIFFNCNKYSYIFFRNRHNITPFHYYNIYISNCQLFLKKTLDKIISL